MPEPQMNPNRALWEKGDFSRIAASMRESGDALVERLGITSGMKVLDLGCGDGTTALPEARRGAEVLGVDISSKLVAAGNERARAAGLSSVRFQEGDATDLRGLDDESFDLVVSIFGAMFAPRPLEAAREMVRVARRGGRIVMGNWIPNDPTMVAQLLKISTEYMPPPPEGFIRPMKWGVERDVVERFAAAGVPPENVSCDRETFTFVYQGAPSEYVTEFERYYGPTMNAFEAAEKTGRSYELRGKLVALFERENTSADKDVTIIPVTFLRVTVVRA